MLGKPRSGGDGLNIEPEGVDPTRRTWRQMEGQVSEMFRSTKATESSHQISYPGWLMKRFQILLLEAGAQQCILWKRQPLSQSSCRSENQFARAWHTLGIVSDDYVIARIVALPSGTLPSSQANVQGSCHACIQVPSYATVHFQVLLYFGSTLQCCMLKMTVNVRG